MKKFLVMAALVILGCTTMMAKDSVKITEGSFASLKDGGTGYVVIDMKDTKFDNKKPLRKDERFMMVDEQIPECTSEFVREFNEHAKKFRMVEKAADAQYKFDVKITNLDTYVNVMSFKGGVGIKLWGTITVTKKATGEKIAVITLDEEDNSGFTYQVALEEAFEGIAKNIAKKINKGK